MGASRSPDEPDHSEPQLHPGPDPEKAAALALETCEQVANLQPVTQRLAQRNYAWIRMQQEISNREATEAPTENY